MHATAAVSRTQLRRSWTNSALHSLLRRPQWRPTCLHATSLKRHSSTSNDQVQDLSADARCLLRKILRATRSFHEPAARSYFHTYVVFIARHTSKVERSTIQDAAGYLHQLQLAASQHRLMHPLHLLRHLLRAVSYLPDSAARSFFRSYILGRYRKHPVVSRRTPRSYIPCPRTLSALLANGRKSLASLQAATVGYLRPLTKALHMAYGRIGPRRYTLLAPLKSPPAPRPESPCAYALHKGDPITETLRPFSHVSPAMLADIPRLTPALDALLTSQLRHAIKPDERPQLRKVNFTIPERNTWQRRMPQKRVKNMAREIYAFALDKAISPLPSAEWAALGQLATGEVKASIPRRRTRVGAAADWTDANALDIALELRDAPQLRLGREHPHRITPRLMQRFYARLWSTVPKVAYTPADYELPDHQTPDHDLPQHDLYAAAVDAGQPRPTPKELMRRYQVTWGAKQSKRFRLPSSSAVEEAEDADEDAALLHDLLTLEPAHLTGKPGRMRRRTRRVAAVQDPSSNPV